MADVCYSDDPILGRLSKAQLEAGILRGKEQLTLITALDAMDDDLAVNHGAHDRPSKDFEAWSATDSQRRRAALQYAIREAQNELINRARTVSA